MITVCKTCNDTHRMMIGNYEDGRSEQEVMCTHCPLPCAKCCIRQSPYCAVTPCNCSCHSYNNNLVVAQDIKVNDLNLKEFIAIINDSLEKYNFNFVIDPQTNLLSLKISK